MIRELPQASEVDLYNMMIYLALLGPWPTTPSPRSNVALRNPFLRQSTAWAIDPDTGLPWVEPMANSPVAQYVFESYVRELGDHLKPVAARLVSRKSWPERRAPCPPWGYKLLAKYPDESLKLLTPALADSELLVRERAAVALGYMGRPAATAAPQLSQALKSTEDEREQRC